MKPVRIPRYIDSPPHILLWQLDELAPSLIGLVVGILLGQALICVVIGVLITKFYTKYRDSSPDGYFLHILWKYGFFPANTRTLSDPFLKRYFA